MTNYNNIPIIDDDEEKYQINYNDRNNQWNVSPSFSYNNSLIILDNARPDDGQNTITTYLSDVAKAYGYIIEGAGIITIKHIIIDVIQDVALKEAINYTTMGIAVLFSYVTGNSESYEIVKNVLNQPGMIHSLAHNFLGHSHDQSDTSVVLAIECSSPPPSPRSPCCPATYTTEDKSIFGNFKEELYIHASFKIITIAIFPLIDAFLRTPQFSKIETTSYINEPIKFFGINPLETMLASQTAAINILSENHSNWTDVDYYYNYKYLVQDDKKSRFLQSLEFWLEGSDGLIHLFDDLDVLGKNFIQSDMLNKLAASAMGSVIFSLKSLLYWNTNLRDNYSKENEGGYENKEIVLNEKNNIPTYNNSSTIDNDITLIIKINDTHLYNSAIGRVVIGQTASYNNLPLSTDISTINRHNDKPNISESKIDGDKIIFEADIKLKDLTFKKDENDLVIKIIKNNNDDSSNILAINNWFDPENQIKTISFDDGLSYKLGNLIEASLEKTHAINYGNDNSYDIIEAIEERSTRIYASQTIINGSNKKDYINAYSGAIVNAREGNDAIFAYYQQKPHILNGGEGKDGFIFIAGNNKEIITHVVEDFSPNEDYLEFRGFNGASQLRDLKLEQIEEDVLMHITDTQKVKLLNIKLLQLSVNNVLFGNYQKLSGNEKGALTAIRSINNHLFGSNGDDILSGNGAKFVHLSGGAGNDIINSNEAAIAYIEGGLGDDLIEVSANTAGKISYIAGDLSKGNFGHDDIYCNFKLMKLEVERKEQVDEMMSYLSCNSEGLPMFSHGNWSITLHGISCENVNEGIFSVWEEI